MSKDKHNNIIYSNYNIEFCLRNDKNKNKFSYSNFPKKIFSNKKLKDALFYINKQLEKKDTSLSNKLLLSPKNSLRTLEMVQNNSEDITRNKSKSKQLKRIPPLLINNLENKNSYIENKNKLNMYKIRLIKKGDQNQSNIHLIKQKQLNLYFKNLGIKKEKLNEIFSNKSNKTPNKKINISKFFLSFKEKATSHDFNNSIIIKNINSNINNIQLKNKFLRLKNFNIKQEQNSSKSIKSLTLSNRNKINNSII